MHKTKILPVVLCESGFLCPYLKERYAEADWGLEDYSQTLFSLFLCMRQCYEWGSSEHL